MAVSTRGTNLTGEFQTLNTAIENLDGVLKPVRLYNSFCVISHVAC